MDTSFPAVQTIEPVAIAEVLVSERMALESNVSSDVEAEAVAASANMTVMTKAKSTKHRFIEMAPGRDDA
jgi:hypothetical protein